MSIWETMQDSAMNCVLEFDGQLDEERLRRAMRLTLDAEPILGCRFAERWYRPVWQRRDDLDRLELLRVVPREDGSAIQRFLENTLDPDRDCQVRGELIRGGRDTLCIKFSHKVGDAQALKQYLALLAEVYQRLAEDPDHRPAPNPSTDRNLLQVAPHFDRARRREIRRHFDEHKPANSEMGRWEPVADRGSPGPSVHVRRLDARRFASLFKYACGLRVTTFHVLLGALFLAARELVPHTAAPVLPLLSVVDLRRYGGVRERLALCNLFGVIHMALRPDRAVGLDETAVQVREQMVLKQKQLGLTVPPFSLESSPLVRFALRCLPYKWMKARVGRHLRRMEGGICLLTDIGTFEADRLDFRGATLTEVYVTSGMVRDPRVLLLCVSQFHDTLTICSNVPRAVGMGDLLDRMLATLPG